MIELYERPTSNRHKITTLLEEAGFDHKGRDRICRETRHAMSNPIALACPMDTCLSGWSTPSLQHVDAIWGRLLYFMPRHPQAAPRRWGHQIAQGHAHATGSRAM